MLATAYDGAAPVMPISTPQVYADVPGVGRVSPATGFSTERTASRNLAVCAPFIAGLALREGPLLGWAFALPAFVEAQDAAALLLGAASGELPGVAANPGVGACALVGTVPWVAAALKLPRRPRPEVRPA